MVLKTNGPNFSILHKKSIKDNIDKVKKMFPDDIKLPKVYLIHGELSQKQMNFSVLESGNFSPECSEC